MKKLSSILFILTALSVVVFPACHRKAAAGEEAKTEEKTAEGTVALSPDAARTAGVQIEEVRLRTFYPSIKVSGTVALNQKRYVRITPRVAGRIEKVFAFEGERVRAGQDLYWLYSPELLAAQSDYLQILSRAPAEGKTAVSDDERLHASLLQSTEARLKLMGFEDADLASLRKSRTVLTFAAIRAPFAGTILEATATAGSAVELGAPLCAVTDLSSLWVQVHIFEKDLNAVAPGDRAELIVAGYPGETFEGTLTLVGSIMDEATRTVTGRVEAANAAGKLKPGMFAEVRIISRQPVTALAVPEQAVRTIAGKTVVFMPATGGTFVRRDVVTGRTFEGYVEIVSGLTTGDKVITGGSFDVKAEMLKGTLEGEK